MVTASTGRTCPLMSSQRSQMMKSRTGACLRTYPLSRPSARCSRILRVDAGLLFVAGISALCVGEPLVFALLKLCYKSSSTMRERAINLRSRGATLRGLRMCGGGASKRARRCSASAARCAKKCRLSSSDTRVSHRGCRTCGWPISKGVFVTSVRHPARCCARVAHSVKASAKPSACSRPTSLRWRSSDLP